MLRGDVHETTQVSKIAAPLGNRVSTDQLGTPEQDGRLILNVPALGGNDDCPPRLVAQVDDQTVLVTGYPQMQLRGLDTHDVGGAVDSRAAGLAHDEGQRIRLVQQPQLPARALLVGRIREDPAAQEIADEVLNRDIAGGGSGNTRNVRNALRALRNKVSEAGGTLTVTAEDDVTPAWTAAVVRTASTDPITSVDPA